MRAGENARTNRREGIEALGSRVLHFLVLNVARRDVVDAGDAEDVVPGLRSRDPMGTPADDDRELGLVVDAADAGRQLDRPPGSSTVVDGLKNSSGSGGSAFFISAA